MSIDEVAGGRWSWVDAGTAGPNVSVSVHVSGAWTIVAIAGEMDPLVCRSSVSS